MVVPFRSFDHLSAEDGLVGGAVQAIVEDRQGFMWFGTQQGLNRYDVTGVGSQRVRCRACGKRYTPTPKPAGYAPDVRTQALKMYVDGLNFRRIARLLGMHHQTVINWVNAAADRVPAASPGLAITDTIELVELYTFIAQKKSGSTL